MALQQSNLGSQQGFIDRLYCMNHISPIVIPCLIAFHPSSMILQKPLGTKMKNVSEPHSPQSSTHCPASLQLFSGSSSRTAAYENLHVLCYRCKPNSSLSKAYFRKCFVSSLIFEFSTCEQMQLISLSELFYLETPCSRCSKTGSSPKQTSLTSQASKSFTFSFISLGKASATLLMYASPKNFKDPTCPHDAYPDWQ